MLYIDRLKKLLADRGITQSELSRILGVSPSAVHQILSGKTQNSRLIPKIAQYLRVSEPYLRGQTDDPFLPVSGSMSPRELVEAMKLTLSGTSLLEEGDALKPAFLTNAFFDPDWLLTQISSFDPSIADHSDPDYYPPILTTRAGTDAMSPTIRRGDEVTISMESRTVDTPDGIWIISYGGLLMIRRLMPLPNDRGFRVFADDPASPTFEAPASDIEIYGRAFWVGRSLA